MYSEKSRILIAWSYESIEEWVDGIAKINPMLISTPVELYISVNALERISSNDAIFKVIMALAYKKVICSDEQIVELAFEQKVGAPEANILVCKAESKSLHLCHG